MFHKSEKLHVYLLAHCSVSSSVSVRRLLCGQFTVRCRPLYCISRKQYRVLLRCLSLCLHFSVNAGLSLVLVLYFSEYLASDVVHLYNCVPCVRVDLEILLCSVPSQKELQS